MARPCTARRKTNGRPENGPSSFDRGRADKREFVLPTARRLYESDLPEPTYPVGLRSGFDTRPPDRDALSEADEDKPRRRGHARCYNWNGHPDPGRRLGTRRRSSGGIAVQDDDIVH